MEADAMRTSKISQETTRIFSALSPNARKTRSTRSSGKGIATFALGYDGNAELQEDSHSTRSISRSPTVSDIEDVESTPKPSRKRKFGVITPSSMTTKVIKTEHESSWTSPRLKKIKKETESDDEHEGYPESESGQASPSGRVKAKPKIPAKKQTLPGGEVRFIPPSNWEEVYSIIKNMRERNPVAPVDTMGCEDLFWQTAPPDEKRYHTLVALMLSSQTKDTVTAAAMQRLHTELVPQKPDPSTGKILKSSLTIQNVLNADPKHLNELISKVGFHNNKTRYIQQVAGILSKPPYNHTIPNTIEGLVALPGVGPKMAYLCMSAAWGEDVGIGVDVHVHRITNLWGWHKTKSPEETRMWLEGWLPRDRWHEINKMLVGLGQLVCLPIGRRCGECDLAGKGLCKAEVKGWKDSRVKREKVEKVEVEMKDEAGHVLQKQTLSETRKVKNEVKIEPELVEK